MYFSKTSFLTRIFIKQKHAKLSLNQEQGRVARMYDLNTLTSY